MDETEVDTPWSPLIDALPIGALLLVGGTVRRVNRAAVRMFAMSADRLEGRRLPTLFDAGAVVAIDALVAGARVGSRSSAIVAASGGGNGEWLVAAAALDDGGLADAALVTLTDLVDRRAGERRRADESSDTRDHILAVVSHELRSPLNGIQSWSHVIEYQLDRMTDVPPLVMRALDGIRSGVEEQVRLIEQLNVMTKAFAGDLEFAMSPIVLARVVDDAIDSFRPDAIAKDVDVVVERGLDGDEVRGDADRVEQIIAELLSNALKFTPPGGRIVVATARRHDDLEVTVSDTGRGLDDGFERWLFEPFRQGEDTNIRRTGGLGLGLALCRRIVEQHDGTIAAHSAGTARGATFLLTLPRLPRREAPVPATSVHGAPTGFELGGIRALVIDDQVEAREALGTLLAQFGASVDLAASSRDGLAVIDRGPSMPDVVVCDIAMPDEDGYGFLGRLRDRESRAGAGGIATPVVALSAFATQPAPANGPRFDYYLSKPVHPQTLLATLSRATGRTLATDRSVDAADA